MRDTNVVIMMQMETKTPRNTNTSLMSLGRTRATSMKIRHNTSYNMFSMVSRSLVKASSGPLKGFRNDWVDGKLQPVGKSDDNDDDDEMEEIPAAAVRQDVSSQRAKTRRSAYGSRGQQSTGPAPAKRANLSVLNDEELAAIDALKKRGVQFEDESEDDDDDDSDSSSDTPIIWARGKQYHRYICTTRSPGYTTETIKVSI